MIFCERCGQPNNEETKFCKQCGSTTHDDKASIHAPHEEHVNANNTNSKETLKNNIGKTTLQVRPWVRGAARLIDFWFVYYTFCFLAGVIGCVVCYLFGIPLSRPINNISNIENSQISPLGALSLFIWVFVESLLLSTWGTTPGKWLLKINLRDSAGKKLTFKNALSRSFSVWWRGIGIGLFAPITLIIADIKIRKKGITSWDRDGNFTVTHDDVGILRSMIAVLLICSIFSLNIYYHIQSKNAVTPLKTSLQWKLYNIGQSGLCLESPAQLQPVTLPVQNSRIQQSEGYACNLDDNFALSCFSIVCKPGFVGDSARAAYGSVMEMKEGTLDFKYTTQAITKSGILGTFSKGSYKVNGEVREFQNIHLSRENRLWMVIVIYNSANSDNSIIAKKILDSIYLEK